MSLAGARRFGMDILLCWLNDWQTIESAFVGVVFAEAGRHNISRGMFLASIVDVPKYAYSFIISIETTHFAFVYNSTNTRQKNNRFYSNASGGSFVLVLLMVGAFC